MSGLRQLFCPFERLPEGATGGGIRWSNLGRDAEALDDVWSSSLIVSQVRFAEEQSAAPCDRNRLRAARMSALANRIKCGRHRAAGVIHLGRAKVTKCSSRASVQSIGPQEIGHAFVVLFYKVGAHPQPNVN